MHQTPFYLSWACWVRSYSPLYFPKPLLDCEHDDGNQNEEPEGDYEVYYEEPNLSGGIEGVDYDIVYDVDEGEARQ